MDIGSNIFLVSLLAFVLMLLVFGPPAWWYWHGRIPGEKRERKWGTILFGVLVIISIGYIKTAKGDWIGWATNMVRVIGGAWLIAFGARGSRIN